MSFSVFFQHFVLPSALQPYLLHLPNIPSLREYGLLGSQFCCQLTLVCHGTAHPRCNCLLHSRCGDTLLNTSQLRGGPCY